MQDKESSASTGATGAIGASGPSGPSGPTDPGSQQPTSFWGQLEKQVQHWKEEGVKYIGPSVSVIIILVLTWVVSSWARRAMRAGLEKARFDVTLSKFFANTARWIVLTVGVLFCLNVFGINTTTFAAVLGAAGLAIGLALQGSLANMAAGVMLLVFRPFKVGDTITVVGQSGIIHEIDLFTTSMDSADGRRIIIPNGQIFGNTIDNATYHPKRRVDVKLSVSLNNDLDHVRALLHQAAMGVPGRLAEQDILVVLSNMGATFDWEVSIWAKTTELADVRQALLKAIREELVRAQIELPSPAMTVTLKQPS